MAVKVVVYAALEKPRSRQIGEAMLHGLKRSGVPSSIQPMLSYRYPDADVAIFYGLMRPILEGYKRVGRPAIYIDLGYWGRHEGGRRQGFHKLSLNSRHPTAYFQKRKHDAGRFNHFRVPIQPWKSRNEGYILLVGMSAKAAAAEGFRPEQWERQMVSEIRKYSDREIIYRPKPSWHAATTIPGTRRMIGVDGDIDKTHFRNCYAVVTHHSNAAIEGLLAGVPVFVWDGVATAPGKGSCDISRIESPPTPTEREQWAYDIAWTQWNVAEMQSGQVWDYLKQEGLVPA